MLGIAIINYNKYDKTIDCIQSIFKTVHNIDYKIYLLDNDSPNESYSILYDKYKNNPRVECFKSDENCGYARGNNLCIDKAKKDGCDYILISNNDIIFAENAVNLLLKDIMSTDYLLIAPALKYPSGAPQVNIKTSRPSFKKYMMSETYLHNFDKKRKYRSITMPNSFSQVYWASGAVFIADLKKFEKIGFFDPNTFLYFEEYIIAEKAVKNELQIGFEPNAAAYHYHGASTGGAANYITRLENFKSEMYFCKNYWVLTKKQLKQIRLIRCLEVLFTFTKEHKIKDAVKFVVNSRKILKG